jgi:hypothetical protein
MNVSNLKKADGSYESALEEIAELKDQLAITQAQQLDAEDSAVRSLQERDAMQKMMDEIERTDPALVLRTKQENAHLKEVVRLHKLQAENMEIELKLLKVQVRLLKQKRAMQS